MGWVEPNRAGLLAPAFGLKAFPSQARIEYGADRKQISTFLGLAALVDFGRGIAVVVQRVGLQLVVVTDPIKAGQGGAANGTVAKRSRTNVVDAQAAAMGESDRLTNLNRARQSFGFIHPGTLRPRG